MVAAVYLCGYPGSRIRRVKSEGPSEAFGSLSVTPWVPSSSLGPVPAPQKAEAVRDGRTTCFAKSLRGDAGSPERAARLIESAGDGVKSSGILYKSQFTKEIEADLYLNQWDNFLVGKLKPILKNNLSLDGAAMARIHICLGTAAKSRLLHQRTGRVPQFGSGLQRGVRVCLRRTDESGRYAELCAIVR